MIQKAQSIGDIGTILHSRLEKLELAKGIPKQDLKKVVISDADSGSDSDDLFKEEEGAGSMMSSDPTKLIDFELIKLLSYCLKLREYKDNEDYEDELMLKAFTLGKATKTKTVIFDMDETLVAAKFEGRIPNGFQPTFKF